MESSSNTPLATPLVTPVHSRRASSNKDNVEGDGLRPVPLKHHHSALQMTSHMSGAASDVNQNDAGLRSTSGGYFAVPTNPTALPNFPSEGVSPFTEMPPRPPNSAGLVRAPASDHSASPPLPPTRFHAPRESSIIEIGTESGATPAQPTDEDGIQPGSAGAAPRLVEDLSDAPDSASARRQSGPSSWLDTTSQILRSSFLTHPQQLPTSMMEANRMSSGVASASSSPSFGSVRFTGRSGTMSAGPSPSIGAKRYMGSAGYNSAGPSPPFHAMRYTGSAGPSPSSGPVRVTGASALGSNASASASGTSVVSFASTSGGAASSRSSPPPPSSISGFPAGQHVPKNAEEWSEYMHLEGEMRGRQRGLDKALELIRERSQANGSESAEYDDDRDGPQDWEDDQGDASGRTAAVAYASQHQAWSLRATLTWPARTLARFLRWIASLSTPALLIFFVLLIAFVASTASTIKYVLNPDKEPKPWRLECAKQPAFPHELADSLAPVDVFVGVFSVDSSFERRSLIRHTYAAHTLPLSQKDGTPMANVQVKFILGRPRKGHELGVLLEQEMYNDLVLLDVDENMNKGKTREYFRWASENATIPIVLSSSPAASDSSPTAVSPRTGRDVKWKMADYIVKADEDSFLVLSELERHLRLIPRTKAYWGYLIGDRFMAGECYALSSDLVRYIAQSSQTKQLANGKEDQQVAEWLKLHPEAQSIRYESQHCWIYDHPKAGTAYSHGFLFPDYVAEVKDEIRYGIPSAEIGRRGGPRAALSHSTVSKWKQPYRPPRSDLTIEERVEALVEGGGRWAKSGGKRNDTQLLQYPRHEMVFDAVDPRIRPSGMTPNQALRVDQLRRDPQTGLALYEAQQLLGGRSSPSPLLSVPVSKDENGVLAALRHKRFQGKLHGGTIVIHYIKKSDWYLETALALIGKPALRIDGAGGPGSEWSMT